MRKFYKHVVEHQKPIIFTFFLLALMGLVLSNLVSVNYDMKDYFPADSPSTISLDIMQSEYDGGIPNARVMVRNVSITQALDYKDRLLACEGVTDVLWLDDATDIYKPLETLDTDKGGNQQKGE